MTPAFLQWIHDSLPGQLVREIFWVSPTLEALHFVGMALLVGVVVIIDLRIFGVAPELSVSGLHRFLPWAFAGFAVNLISGLLFFAADPQAYAFNPAFRLKMLCILLAGMNVLWFRIAVLPNVDEILPAPLHARLICVVSLLLWSAAIVCGRLIPYVPDV